jgi:hypothetical protein
VDGVVERGGIALGPARGQPAPDLGTRERLALHHRPAGRHQRLQIHARDLPAEGAAHVEIAFQHWLKNRS